MSSFGQILKEVGEFGSFQKRLLAALCVPGIFAAFNIIGQVFVGLNFPHHCNTDWILKRWPNLTEERRRNLTIPVDKDGRFESCKMFTPVDLDLETIEAYGINSTSECINGWDYEAPTGVSSIVTELDLVCDKSGLIELSQSIFMAGYLVGALMSGTVSDRFGRRFGNLFFLFSLVLSGMATAFSPNIYVYIILKFFCGISGVVVITITVTAVEWTGPSKASFCTTMILLCYPVGLMLLPFFAYFIGSWRTQQLVFFSPLILLAGTYYWFLPESARWLMTQGRKEEAQKELLRASRVNGTTLPENLLEKLEVEIPSKKDTMLDIFKIPYLRKQTVIMGFIWFSNSLLYVGLSLNVGSFGLNIYLTQFIFGLVEIPANLSSFALNQRLGRKITEAGFLLFGGAACLLILAIPKDYPVLITVIAVLGKYSVSASFSTAYVYTPELYPTTLRQNGVGLNSVCSRVAGMISPLVRLLEVYHHAIPLLINGIIPIAAGVLCLLLPETLNAELPDHVDVKKQKAESTGTDSVLDKFLKV